MAIAAAAGYPQYSGSLIHPVISARVLERLYETAVIPSICDTSWFGEISQQGDQVTFFRPARAVVRRSTKGGLIKHDTIDTSPVTLSVDYALESSLTYDPLDKRMAQGWATLEASYHVELAKQLEFEVDYHLLNQLYTGNNVAPENKGATAGVITGSVNLGTPGAPILLTPSNVLEFLTSVELVFRERNIDIYREPVWNVSPPQFNQVLMNSDLKSALFSGLSRSTYLGNGRISENKIAGFDIRVTNHAPSVIDAVTGKRCYHVMFGLTKASAFMLQHIASREIEDANGWNKYVQSRHLYGFGVVYPEYLVDCYVTFTP